MITLKSAREIEAMDKAGDFLASIHNCAIHANL